ncbi:hypothetical protein ACWOFR_03775 [Carnobacterium gallinarum]|uniref:hypothetical protein n=1 Tax=Carnobacterium gallinarum TaxID=2749 RepID=UPI000550581D|nr:hypothetical protein [Carnobacterium gallinarum]
MAKEWSILLKNKRYELEKADDEAYKLRNQKEHLADFITQFKAFHYNECALLEEEMELCAHSDVLPFINTQLTEVEDQHSKQYRTLLRYQEEFEMKIQEQSKETSKIEKELTALEKEARL